MGKVSFLVFGEFFISSVALCHGHPYHATGRGNDHVLYRGIDDLCDLHDHALHPTHHHHLRHDDDVVDDDGDHHEGVFYSPPLYSHAPCRHSSLIAPHGHHCHSPADILLRGVVPTAGGCGHDGREEARGVHGEVAGYHHHTAVVVVGLGKMHKVNHWQLQLIFHLDDDDDDDDAGHDQVGGRGLLPLGVVVQQMEEGRLDVAAAGCRYLLL